MPSNMCVVDERLIKTKICGDYEQLARGFRNMRQMYQRRFNLSYTLDLSLSSIAELRLPGILVSGLPLIYFMRHLIEERCVEWLLFCLDVQEFEGGIGAEDGKGVWSGKQRPFVRISSANEISQEGLVDESQFEGHMVNIAEDALEHSSYSLADYMERQATGIEYQRTRGTLRLKNTDRVRLSGEPILPTKESIAQEEAEERRRFATWIYESYLRERSIFELNIREGIDEACERRILEGQPGCLKALREHAMVVLGGKVDAFINGSYFQGLIRSVGDIEICHYKTKDRLAASNMILEYLRSPITGYPSEGAIQEQYLREKIKSVLKQRIGISVAGLAPFVEVEAGTRLSDIMPFEPPNRRQLDQITGKASVLSTSEEQDEVTKGNLEFIDFIRDSAYRPNDEEISLGKKLKRFFKRSKD